MIEDLLRQSSLAEELKAEAEEAADEKVRKMARVALEDHFGPLPDDVLAAIAVTDSDALLTVVSHMSSDTVEQMRARFGLS